MAGSVRWQRHKKMLEHAKGYRGKAGNCFGVAIRRIQTAWRNSYISRRLKKRNWRTLWIVRLNSALKQHNVKYSSFIGDLVRSKIILDRKSLSEIAVSEPASFKAVLEAIKVSNPAARINIKPLSQQTKPTGALVVKPVCNTVGRQLKSAA